MRSVLLAMTAAIAPFAAAPAQQLLAYDPFAAQITEAQPWTAMLPWPGGPTNIYPAVPMPPGGAGVPLPGDSTWDGINGLHWLCNGAMLASQANALYPPLAPPLPPFPIAPPVLAAIGGFVTGIALDPAANIMWLCGPPGVVIGVTPLPGTPVVVPPFPLLFPTGPLAGLEWDGLTATFLTVDVAGIVYPFLPGGAPAGPPILAAFPFPGPIGDVAIDKSGQNNPAAVRPIYVVGGPMVVDVTLAVPLPFPVGPPMNAGLAYMGAPATNPPGPGGGPACACPSFPAGPTLFTTSVMSAGNAAWGIGVGGIPAGQPVVFAFDFRFNPAWPMINGVGCPLGFRLGSPTLVAAFGFANAAGTANYPFPLVVPAGFGPIYNQNFTLCPADPAGIVLTAMQSIWASGL
ncbi:MAG: hypothetical protein KDC98_03030 [Planctomycetes bacterium]|nr:hypothetical protein [Planctomycetota bacterium]